MARRPACARALSLVAWQTRGLFTSLSAVPTRQQAGAVHPAGLCGSGTGLEAGGILDTLSPPAPGCCSARGRAGAGCRGGCGSVGGAEPGPGNRRMRAGEGARQGMAVAADLQELRALVERAGGRRAVLLVAEVAEGAPAVPALAALARDLLDDEAPRAACPGPVPECRARRSPGAGSRALGARLLLVLCGGGAAWDRGARTRLREVVRDVRGRLPAGPPPAVVGVLLPGGDGEDAAVLDAALRRHFPAPGTVQAARYSPGSPGDCRAAACRALRAALQHPAEDMKYRERWRLPSFLQCISWNQRNWRKDNKAKAENNIHKGGPHAGGYKACAVEIQAVL
ncbi:uncharacterized protein C2orf72 homolog isoform 3-T3 [Geothlypis trichas]